MSVRARPSAPAAPRPRFVQRRRRSMPWPCPHPATFAILVVYEPHDLQLQLSGTLDADGAPSLDDCVDLALGEHPRRLVFELSALESIDERGVECLARAAELTSPAGIQAVLDSPNDEIRAALEHRAVLGGFQCR